MAILQANAHFDLQKRDVLGKCDSSRKGSIDEKIVDLVRWINEHADLCTTSSCSGRQILFVTRCGDKTKKGCRWLNCEHEARVDAHACYENLVETMHTMEKDDIVMFKFEAFIMHVQCRSLSTARHLHEIALTSGFRNSGITLGRAGRTTVAVRSTLGLEVPLSCGTQLRVNEQYLQFLFDEARRKFDENDALISRLFTNLKTAFAAL